MTEHNFSVMLGAKIQVLKHMIHFKIGSKSPSKLFCNWNLVCRLRSHLSFKVNERVGSVPWNSKCTFGFGPEGGSANIACDYGPFRLREQDTGCTCGSSCSSRTNRWTNNTLRVRDTIIHVQSRTAQRHFGQQWTSSMTVVTEIIMEQKNSYRLVTL